MIGRLIYWCLNGKWLDLPKLEDNSIKIWCKELSFGKFEIYSKASIHRGYNIKYYTNIGQFYRDLSDFGGMGDNYRIYVEGKSEKIETSEEIANAIREYEKNN